MEYRVLGPLEVVGDDGPLALGGAKQRALLALLVLNANRVVSRERLVDALWGDDPPETAVTSIQVYVSRWRKVLPPDALVTRAPGYLLAARPDEIDLLRFESLVAEARGAAPQRSASLLRKALALWRGPALGGLALESSARTEPDRLEELRLAALEERIEADLALGRHAELAGELQTLIGEHPHRERLRGQLMLALYRSGRQADALEAYREARAALDELGIEPSEELRQLERRILAHDPQAGVPRALIPEGTALPGPLRVSSPFPFVGRERELDALRSLLACAEQGKGGRVALLRGEAGSGKTRLARRLAQEAAQRGTLVLYGASNADVTVPYGPFVDALEFLVRIADPTELAEIVGARDLNLTMLVPKLGATASPLPTDPEAARRRLHGAVVELLLEIGVRRPLLIVLDDIHWADSGSMQLLRELARVTPEGRLVTLVIYRDRSEDERPELATALGGLARLDEITRLQSDRLSSDDIGELIERSCGVAPTPELTDALCSLTHGTAFLVCQLWQALLDTGAVETSENAVRLTRPVTELSTPENVRDVVRYRLSRLAPTTRSVLEVAAVAGPSFELGLLGDEREVVASIEEAVDSGMVETIAETGIAHRFTHELVRRALYDGLSSIRRAELHLRVGEGLEQAHPDDLDSFAADLAYHFTLACPVAGPARAVKYAVRAARKAKAALAFVEAARLLSTALELADDERVRAELSAELGFALRYTGETERATSVLRKGIDAAHTAGDRHLAARATVELAELSVGAPDFVERATQRDVRDAIEVFEEVGDDLGLSKAWHVLGTIEWFHCRFAAAEPNYLRALSHADRAGDRRERTTDLLVLAGVALHGPMPVPRAIERCESVLADTKTDRLAEPGAAVTLGVLLAMDGDLERARGLAERSIAVCVELGLLRRVVDVRESFAMIELLGGRLDAAEQQLRLARATLLELGSPSGVGSIAAMLADVLAQLGRFDDAERLTVEARDNTGATDVFGQITLRRAAARIACFHGNVLDAERLISEARTIAAGTDALNVQADLCVDLAAVLDARQDIRGSRRALEQALELYSRKGNRVEVTRTEAALTEATTLEATS